jgi:hypothetical protein
MHITSVQLLLATLAIVVIFGPKKLPDFRRSSQANTVELSALVTVRPAAGTTAPPISGPMSAPIGAPVGAPSGAPRAASPLQVPAPLPVPDTAAAQSQLLKLPNNF